MNNLLSFWMALTIVAFTTMGVWIGYVLRIWVGNLKAGASAREADQLIMDARREADTLRKEAALQAKEEVFKAKEEFEASIKSRREEQNVLDSRLAQREANMDRRAAVLEKKERGVEQRELDVERQAEEGEKTQAELKKLMEEEKAKLQRVAGLTAAEARQALLARVEAEVHGEVGGRIRRAQEEARETAEREARKIVSVAIQRYASSHASEIMTSTVALPSDDMKGRIIGREGRNIRALEALTGVNFLIDDTPEAVVISGFDPVRREVARLSLEQLIRDGRIHPARIEEVVAKTREEMETRIREAGEEAAYSVGVQGLDPELVRTLGRLKFRSSYSQNVMMHSIEVAQLMGVMAGELGLDVALAKRVGLLHDLGKALDHDQEGSHAALGADLLRKLGENAVVVNAVAAHHEEAPAESLYAILAAAADAISAARPGARSETTDIYVKRLEKLEGIAGAFPGVERCYAIQAGREMRVLVLPDQVNDDDAMILARNICKKIENELQYPGQIKVTVVRETRCVEYAR